MNEITIPSEFIYILITIGYILWNIKKNRKVLCGLVTDKKALENITTTRFVFNSIRIGYLLTMLFWQNKSIIYIIFFAIIIEILRFILVAAFTWFQKDTDISKT